VNNVYNIPFAPRGVTLSSFARLIYHVNGHSSFDKTYKRLFGCRLNGHAMLFGAHARFCAQVIGKGTFGSSRSILENHTVLPFFAYTLPVPMREAWYEVQGTSERYPSRRFSSQRRTSQILKERCHGCTACIENDLEEYGIGFWRVEHQLQGIVHCPTHRIALFSACNRCGSFNPSFFNSELPTPKCKTCGARFAPPQSANMRRAYWRMLDLVRHAFEGNWHILTPEFRTAYFASRLQELDQWPATPELACEILGKLQSEWGMSSGMGLRQQLPAELSVESVYAALCGTLTTTDPLLLLMLMVHLADSDTEIFIDHVAASFAVEMKWGSFNYDDTSSWEAASSEPFSLPQCKDQELRQALSWLGLPTEIADDLATGRRSWTSSLIFRCGATKTRSRPIFYMLQWFHGYTETLRRSVAREPRSVRRNSSTESTRDRHRATCLAYMSSCANPTRTKFSKDHHGAYKWMQAHDRCWFETQIPSLRQPTATLARPMTIEWSREQILELLKEHPDAKRTELWRLRKCNLLWANFHDYEWLQEKLPPCDRRQKRTI
jgi:hypothetical protein